MVQPVNDATMNRQFSLLCIAMALALLPFNRPSIAADLPVKARAFPSVFDWTGFYLGGHVGYGGGGFGPGTNPLPQHGVVFPHSVTGVFGGYQAGYNFQLSNKLVLGVETDVFFTGPLDRPNLVSAAFHTTFDYAGTARGRVGYAFGALLPYVSGGLAFGRTRIDINDADGNPADKKSQMHFGWVWGTGVEYALGDVWSGKIEYNYIDLGARTYAFDGMPLPDTTGQPRVHAVKLGLNFRLGDVGRSSASASGTPALSGLDWNVHGQTTLITQGYPRFRSPYQGANSLPGGGLGRETWTVSAMVGWRLWDGGEVYFNPEMAQGFGIGSTLGLAGFSNGEAQKGGAEYPKFRAQRYYYRQTFGLGGGDEDVADAFGQLAGKRDIDRITVTVGRFAVGDFFDGNSYAKDPRAVL